MPFRLGLPPARLWVTLSSLWPLQWCDHQQAVQWPEVDTLYSMLRTLMHTKARSLKMKERTKTQPALPGEPTQLWDQEPSSLTQSAQV